MSPVRMTLRHPSAQGHHKVGGKCVMSDSPIREACTGSNLETLGSRGQYYSKERLWELLTDTCLTSLLLYVCMSYVCGSPSELKITSSVTFMYQKVKEFLSYILMISEPLLLPQWLAYFSNCILMLYHGLNVESKHINSEYNP